jgi:hypothetical protein
VKPVATPFAVARTAGTLPVAPGAKTVAAVAAVGCETVTVTATALKRPAAGNVPADASPTVTGCPAARRRFERYAVNGVTEWYVEAGPAVTDGLSAAASGRPVTAGPGVATAFAGTTATTPAAATNAAARRLRRWARWDDTTFRR